MIEGALASMVLLATPLVLTAMGGLINRLGGIVNIGLEGKMLVGALVGALVSAASGSWLLGLIAAAAAGAVVGLLFSWTVTRLGANMIIAGLGLNILLAGLIGYWQVQVYGTAGSLRPEGLQRMPRIAIPIIEDVPYLGALLSNKDPLTWFAWLLVPLVVVVLARTRWGLRVRAAGAGEDAARSLGLPVLRVRDASTAVAGALAALGGAHLSLALVGLFSRGMTAGRGFIALAAFYFGRNHPWPTAAACLLFAGFDALQIRLQGIGVPAQLLQTLPYLVVIIVLAAAGLRETRASTRQLVTTT